MHFMDEPGSCAVYDADLKKLTFLRYLVMGIVLFIRTQRIREEGKDQALQPTIAPYCDHPKLTRWMSNSNWFISLFLAGCIFIQSEGVGFTVYFSCSALMDNFTIYLFSSADFCLYVRQVALFSMALLTFLPTCIVAYVLQGRWYDRGRWVGMKSVFLVVMVLASLASFLIRLYLVNEVGWDRTVESMLRDNHHKVLIAVLVPTAVDFVQSVLLVAAALKTKRVQRTPPEGDDEAPPTFVSVESSRKSVLLQNGSWSACSDTAVLASSSVANENVCSETAAPGT